MQQHIKLIIVGILGLSLIGCIYQPNIQQGNVYTQQQVNQLRPGMTKQQVMQIMGEPILADNFNANRWAYVYTFQKNGGKIEKKQLNLEFTNDRLTAIN